MREHLRAQSRRGLIKHTLPFALLLLFGWASAKFNEASVGVPRRVFNLVGADFSLIYVPNPRFYLKPHIEFTHVADRQLRRRLDSPTIGNFGLAVGFNVN